MLDGIRERLAGPDTMERHRITARLVGSPATIVDIGGGPGQFAEYARGASVTSVNVDDDADVVVTAGPHPLPFEDEAFQAAVSLDTLEHIPRPDRALFVSEALRVSEVRAVICCPLGTPERHEIEVADNAWYQEIDGQSHRWIGEHLEHGPPTLDELRELFASPDHDIRFWFHGDVREISRQFRMAETSLHTRHPRDMLRWYAFRVPYRSDLTLDEQPGPWTNRVFVVAERRPSAS